MMEESRRKVVLPAEGPLTGVVRVPADKSITHRALLFAALNHGRTTISNPSLAADPRSTLALVRSLGVSAVERDGAWLVAGGARARHADDLLLDCGNSGTTARLAAGFLCGERGRFTLVGDPSLSRRPMERVAAPLRSVGASVTTTDGHLPMTIESAGDPRGASGRAIDVASAQVHGALLLAGLRSVEGILLRRTRPMRDHSLVMARAFGANVTTTVSAGVALDMVNPSRIERDVTVHVPGDLSSAAFIVGAALHVPGSDVRIEGVGLNPTRIALLDCLRRMGARVEWGIEADEAEPIGWIRAEHSPEMTAIDLSDDVGVPAVSEMMDELPLLALIAARARGTTIVRGAAELRVKESDRIAALGALLRAVGVEIEELPDGFVVRGPQTIAGGGTIDHHDDHRLAMVAAVAGLAAEHPVVVPSPEVVSVSYPEFWDHLDLLASGSRILHQ